MPVISFIRRQDRAASSRSVRVRHSKENALGQGGTGQGIQQTQPKCSDDASLGTEAAIEARIAELEAAKTAAANSGDLATFKILKAECDAALAMRSPATLARLEAERRAFVEHAKTLGDYGLYYVPAAWLKSPQQLRVMPKSAESFDGLDEAEADARGAA